MLAEVGLLTREECDQIEQTLVRIRGELDRDIGFRSFGGDQAMGSAQFFGVKARGNSIV